MHADVALPACVFNLGVVQMAESAILYQKHDKVDVWDGNGWWEGVVLLVLKTRVHVRLTASQHVVSALLQNVRSSVGLDISGGLEASAGKPCALCTAPMLMHLLMHAVNAQHVCDVTSQLHCVV